MLEAEQLCMGLSTFNKMSSRHVLHAANLSMLQRPGQTLPAEGIDRQS